MKRRISAVCREAGGPVFVLARPEHIAGMHDTLSRDHCVSALTQPAPTQALAPAQQRSASYLLSHPDVKAFRAAPSLEASPLDLQPLARRLGVPVGEPLGPTIGALAKACHTEFHKWLSTSPDASASERNEAGSEIVYAAVRRHFKSGIGTQQPDGALKSSNKRYAQGPYEQGTEVADRDQRETRRQDSLQKMWALDNAGANLETWVENRVGQCGDFAALAVHLARHLGLTANVWKFIGSTDPHVFCVIGDVPSIADVNQPAGRLDKEGRWESPGLRVVDGWAGVCCDSADFRARFEAKMIDWEKRLKMVNLATEEFGPARWLSPTSDAWARATFKGAVQKDTKSHWWGYVPE